VTSGGHRVFVYGSLMSGLEHHDTLAHASFLGPATTLVTYRLYAIDYYPAAVIDDAGCALEGELYQVDDLTLAALDAVEDAPGYFERARTAVSWGAEAFIYVLPRERLPRGDGGAVDGGSWRAHRQAQNSHRHPR
jgi:gamma-glutamylaminecyclotransferase